MFDPKAYREACSRLTLGQEKIEEMISMTENQSKKRLRRPARMALIAAALAGMLCVTASAAQLPAVQDIVITLKNTLFVTGTSEIGTFTAVKLPEVILDGTVLTVDGETVDCADELAKNGEYTYHKDLADSSFDVVVKADGTYTVTGYDADGGAMITFTSEAGADSADGKCSVTITDENGRPVTGEDGTVGLSSTYTVITEDTSSVEVGG